MNTKNNRYLTTVEANTYNQVATLIEIINELISILEYTKRNPIFYMSAIVEKGLNSIKRHDEIKDLTNLLLAFEYTPRYDEIIEAISHFKALCQEMGTKIDISMPEYEMRFKGEIISCCLLLGEFANKINKRTPQPGDYGGMSVEDFVTGCAIADISGSDHSAIGERVRYMMAECKDANIRRELEQWLLLHVGDAGTPATPTPAPPAVGEAHQLAEEYTEAEERPDTSTPDFLHMRSFSPTGNVNMGALYSFLIDEKVIKNIDEQLFTDCITHANINELWGKCIKSKMKCVLHKLKNHFEKDWFCSICASVGQKSEYMGKFNLKNKRKQFEMKIIDMIQKPQQKP